MKKLSMISAGVFLSFAIHAQDSTRFSRTMDSITIISLINQQMVKPLPVVSGTYLFGGKKTEIIELSHLPVDITNKSGRQVFAKIPGVFVYDMDGAGNQVNIAARGLDPHRGWEFNNRMDGVLINSDMYGYPASHFSMPLESTGRIEIVRGTGSLQYGAQFGGMLNYITKTGDTTRPFSFESINTAGSYNLLSSYNAIGGKSGKWSYYAYVQKKSRDGYRDGEHTDAHAESAIITFQPSTKLSIRAQWARSSYRYKIPGALTDSMFGADPRQATRSRNYFSPDIHVPSLTLNWNLSALAKIQLTTSAVLGRRNSVLFDKPTNVRDTINASTNQYNNRQVDIDRFNSYTTELRWLQQYRLGKSIHFLSAGVQYMNNDLHRTQLGKGTTGSDYDLSLVDPVWGRDLHFKTKNLALFAENRFQLLKNLAVNAGVRTEIGQTDLSGMIVYYPGNAVPVTIRHHFPLFGFNFSYTPSAKSEIYGGWSQAYRPMLFKDLVPASLYEKVDPQIKDAAGYNAELGFRGDWRFLKWDLNAFVLQYNNRFGTLAMTDNSGSFFTYRTNIGNSFTKGLELLLQADWQLNNHVLVSVFSSTAFTDARYTNAVIKSGNNNIDLRGKKVESAPNLITRNGLNMRFKKFSAGILYSYTASSFADPLNTKEPLKTTGAVGLVPAYGLLDINGVWRISRHLEWRMSVNNFFNKKYFTKRPLFYPGPGIWPSDGRNASATLMIKL